MEASYDYLSNRRFEDLPREQIDGMVKMIRNRANFAFGIMFLRYKEKQKIFDFIKEKNIYQNINYNAVAEEYIQNLPPFIPNMPSSDKDGRELFRMLDLMYEHLETSEIYMFHEYLLKYISSKFPQYKVLY
jgi:hypothetical protein